MGWIIFIGGFILLFVAIIWSTYNKFVLAENQVDEAFSMIDVQLKKRFDLIPNLVEMVKGYNQHEADVLMEIVSKRGDIPEATAPKAALDGSITARLQSFRVQVENYPELRANTQFLKLMDGLSLVEEELAMARRYYNGTVRDYHNKLQVFPNVLFAGFFGMKKKAFYEITSSEALRPEIQLTDSE